VQEGEEVGGQAGPGRESFVAPHGLAKQKNDTGDRPHGQPGECGSLGVERRVEP